MPIKGCITSPIASCRTQVIGVDEGQFFDMELVYVCNKLADAGKRVIVAGLDQDFRGKPFDPMPQLLSVAEYITKHGLYRSGVARR